MFVDDVVEQRLILLLANRIIILFELIMAYLLEQLLQHKLFPIDLLNYHLRFDPQLLVGQAFATLQFDYFFVYWLGLRYLAAVLTVEAEDVRIGA